MDRKLTMEDLHWRPIGAKVKTRDGSIRTVERKIYSHYEDTDGTLHDECTLVYLLDDKSILDPHFPYEVVSTGTTSTCQPRRCVTCLAAYERKGLLIPEEESLIPVKTPCHCGAAGQLVFAARRYFVICTACKFTSEGSWETMTVAVIDWEGAVRRAIQGKRRPKIET